MQHNAGHLSFEHERIRRVKERVESNRRRPPGDDTSARHRKGKYDDGDHGSHSSAWTGVSPSSSDFETISDSELAGHPSALANATARPTGAHAQPSALGRSLSRTALADADARLTRMRESSVPTPDTGESSGKEADGDDEFSELDGDSGRGRGRTRERRRREDDPAVKKTLLEDALRSSLATLLTLSAHPQTMSPALSHTSLTSLLGAYSPVAGSSSPRRAVNNLESLARLPSPTTAAAPGRHSPFSFAMSDPFLVDESEAADEDAREFQAREDARQWEEDPSSTSEGDLVEHAYDLSDDERTQLAPRRPIAIPHSHSRSRARSNSDSASYLSPIQSRSIPLGPASNSPPTWSRRYRRRNQRRTSISPGPASLEERRRARAAGVVSDAGGSFMDLSPARARGSSSATAYNSVGSSGFHLPPAPATTTTLPPRTSDAWTPEGPLSPTSSFPSSDPVLASSIPTIDLSSDAEMDDGSPSRRAAASRRRHGPDGESNDKAAPGWFGWWGRSIELKVWHLVGLAGLILGVGVGLGAASLFKAPKSTRISLYY